MNPNHAICSHIADLDGVASAVLAAHYLSQPINGQDPTFDVFFADYNNANAQVAAAAGAVRDGGSLWITDLSFKEPSALRNVALAKHKIHVFDHHESSRETMVAWQDVATIHFDSSHTKCAADLVWKYVARALVGHPAWPDLAYLTLAAHSRDLWIRDIQEGEDLTDVVGRLGAEKTFDILFDRPALCREENYTPGFRAAIRDEREFREKCHHMATKCLVREAFEILGQKVYAMATMTLGNCSDVGNSILQENPLGWVAMIDLGRGSISLRTNEETIKHTGISVSQIAQQIDPSGGGHPVAAGVPLENDALQRGSYGLLELLVPCIGKAITRSCS